MTLDRLLNFLGPQVFFFLNEGNNRTLYRDMLRNSVLVKVGEHSEILSQNE
jgi:hypothetical protein